MKKFAIIFGILSSIAVSIIVFFSFANNNDSQKTSDLKIEQKTSTSTSKKSSNKSSSSKDKLEDSKDTSKTSEETSQSTTNSQVVSDSDLGITTLTGEPVDVLLNLKKSEDAYQYDKNANRAFQSFEVMDQSYYEDQVKLHSKVHQAGLHDLPEKHAEIESVFNDMKIQLDSYYDRVQASRTSLDPKIDELKFLISRDFFGGYVPIELFRINGSFKLKVDPSTIKVTRSDKSSAVLLVDAVLIDDEGRQIAYFTSAYENGMFDRESIFYLRDGHIAYDQMSLTLEAIHHKDE